MLLKLKLAGSVILIIGFPAKAELPIDLTLLGMTIFVSLLLLKADSPIEVTLLGIIKLTN